MKESEIDWSKAPEGTTHFGPESEELAAAWYKLDEGEWFAMLTSDDDQWDYSPCVDDERVSQMIQRPAEWNGTGLPPVGTVCEIELSEAARRSQVDRARYIQHDGKAVRIIDHQDVGGAVAAIYAVKVGNHFEYHSLIAGNFRRLRTPKEIAAEAALEEIGRLYAEGGPAAVYDAGYRKIEGEKQ